MTLWGDRNRVGLFEIDEVFHFEGKFHKQSMFLYIKKHFTIY